MTVALTVPRARLRFLSGASLDQVVTPGLHLAVSNGQLFENSFFSLFLHFGKLSVDPSGGTASLDEDPLGWRGTSDLVVTCPMPAFQSLVGNDGNTRVALVINSTPASSRSVNVLGPQLRIYDASMKGHDSVHILCNTSAGVAALSMPAPMANRDCQRVQPKIEARLANGRLQYLCVREDVTCSTSHQLLLKGAPVDTIQKSPCTMMVKLGLQPWRLEFPFPIDQCHSTTASKPG